MGSECRTWSSPIVLDASRTIGSGRQDLMTAPGRFNCYEVYLRAPQSWLDVVVSFEMTTEDVASIVDAKLVRDMERPTLPNGGGVLSTADGALSGLLFQSKGIAADKLRVTALASDAVPEGDEARVIVRAWAEPGLLGGGRLARQNVDLFGPPHTSESFVLSPLWAGPNVIVPVQPDGARFYITRIAHSVLTEVPGVVQLQTRNPTSAIVTVRHAWVVGSVGPNVDRHIEQFTKPLRPDRGDSWEIVPVAGAGLEAFNLTGYVE